MLKYIGSILRWIIDKLGLFLFIVVLLVAVDWSKEQWRERDTIVAELKALSEVVDQLEVRKVALETELKRIRTKFKDYLDELKVLEANAEAAREAANGCRRELGQWGRIRRLTSPKEYAGLVAKCEVAEANAGIWELARDVFLEQAGFPELQRFEEEHKKLIEQIEPLQMRVTQLTGILETGVFNRIVSRVIGVFPLAMMILLGIIALPVGLKAIFFFVLAPQASRMPPINIIPKSSPAEISDPGKSKISVAIKIRKDEELLARHNFVQSLSERVSTRTQWFLNKQLPVASIASGMFLLTRVRALDATGTTAVVSSTKDPLGEISVIDLPEGAAMVIQPRCLAGIVNTLEVPGKITSHWRIGSLHAWLTLQLRYLAFHGPCRLIVKGCRGVKSEVPDNDNPRMIRQAATIGFSANLDYQTIQSEVFVPYLLGEADLFNDKFGGGPGRFIYEEMPYGGVQRGALRRGLEGLGDATLKVFGI